MTGDRLSVDADGRVVLQVRHPWADGTTHLRFEPTAFLERLAVLVPRPRVNLLLYYGVLAPRAAWRAEVVARAAAAAESGDGSAESDARVAARPAGRRWADLMRRAFSTVAKALVDPPEPRRRRGHGRLGVSALRRALTAPRPDRSRGGDRADPAAPRVSHRGAGGAAGACATAEGRRRGLVTSRLF